MSRQLKVGEFSRLAQVTVKALHHYDELGLLKPASIDELTNYRYYTVEQLPRIHRIVALKDLGLSLEQIKLMLDEEMPTEQIRGMLRLKQAEARQQMREVRQQLAMIEFRLRMIEAETNFPILDVVMKSLESMHVLSLTVEERHSMKQVVQALHEAIDKGLIRHTGVTIDVFHGDTIIPLGSPELEVGQHEILLGVEPSQESVTLPELGELTARVEPAIETAATLLLTGEDRFENFERVALLERWTIAHGYRFHNLVRYWLHRGPLHTLNRDEFVVEAQLPVDTGEGSLSA
jgi:DNA-binding transcriptional MerR regulator